MKTVRIAAGQGFWGDWLEAPIRQVRQGPIDYLMLDYLAEVTMSILTKQKQKNPQAGYARDFVQLIKTIAAEIAEKKIKVVANAGGVNPQGCADEVLQIIQALKLSRPLTVAVVTGDDLLSDLDRLAAGGSPLVHLDSKEPLSKIRSRILSVNAYLGCDGIVEALSQGADIVITGRVADPALVLGPLVHEFQWKTDDWDKLAAGTIAGHIIECGAQSSGGNTSVDWQTVPDPANIGFPIAEVSSDGSFVVTKHANTGGRVDVRTVTEQLIYEIGDPQNYYSPDVVADFTQLKLQDLGKDRVQVTGARGRKRPAEYKVSISYADGWMAQGTMVYSWPDAYQKAKRAGEIVVQRLGDLKLDLPRIHTEIIGADSCHGSLSQADKVHLPEVMLRVAVHSQNQSAVERFTREMAPLVLGGPPSATGYAGGKQDVREVAAYWPALIDRQAVSAKVAIRKVQT